MTLIGTSICVPTEEICMSMKISLKMLVAGWMTVTWNTLIAQWPKCEITVTYCPHCHPWCGGVIVTSVCPVFWQTGIATICSFLVVCDRKVSHNDVTVKSWSDNHQKIIMWCIIITFWSLLWLTFVSWYCLDVLYGESFYTW